MTGEPLIDYEALTQNAMRSVVKEVLTRTANSGLPGEHHFYISFDTTAEGASISKRLKSKYPNEMTIVLQHRFWDLNVYDERFEVKLTFDGIPERLVVPYTAIKVFFDPSVRYGLQFEEPDFNSDAIDRTMLPAEMSNLMKPSIDEQDIDMETGSRFPHSMRSPSSQNPTARHLRTASNNETDDTNPFDEEQHETDNTAPDKSRVASLSDEAATSTENNETPTEDDEKADNVAGAEIVSLDAFRKK